MENGLNFFRTEFERRKYLRRLHADALRKQQAERDALTLKTPHFGIAIAEAAAAAEKGTLTPNTQFGDGMSAAAFLGMVAKAAQAAGSFDYHRPHNYLTYHERMFQNIGETYGRVCNLWSTAQSIFSLKPTPYRWQAVESFTQELFSRSFLTRLEPTRDIWHGRSNKTTSNHLEIPLTPLAEIGDLWLALNRRGVWSIFAAPLAVLPGLAVKSLRLITNPYLMESVKLTGPIGSNTNNNSDVLNFKSYTGLEGRVRWNPGDKIFTTIADQEPKPKPNPKIEPARPSTGSSADVDEFIRGVLGGNGPCG